MSNKKGMGRPMNTKSSLPVSGGEAPVRAPAPDVNVTQAAGLDRRDFLWRIIGRYDFYINTTNGKAAFLIAFNVFVVSGVVLKWSDLFQLYGGGFPFANLATAILLAMMVLASLASLFCTFMAVNPFLKSPKEPENYHSAIFFGHVAQYDEPEKYLRRVKDLDEEKAVKDLAYQAHVLAKATIAKFGWIKRAVGVILFVQLPVFTLLVGIVVFVLIARQYTG
jgi:hypothetical protein